MKKLLLLISALLTLGVNGAWAQTPVTSITSGKSYYFFNSCFDQFINSNLKTDRTLANAIKFTLTESNGNYNIYSADKSGYLTWGTLSNGQVPTISAATSENTLWTIDVQSGITMNIYPKGQNSIELISQSTTADKAIAFWAFNNQGGQWYIYEAEDFEEIIAAKNSITSGKGYRIYTYNNGTEEGSTKYYLTKTGYLTDTQASAGVFTFTATTSKGAVPTGLSWFVKNLSGTSFTNPEQSTRDNHIHQSDVSNRQDWDTQVFYLKNGKYAIRATNAAHDATWNSSVFWKVDSDDDASGLPDADYALTSNEKHYIWELEEVPPINITYNVKMGGVTVATTTLQQLPGVASSLPTSLQNNYVTIGDPDISTVSEVNNVVNYTATLKDGFPFTYSTDYDNPTWYYWKLNGNYVSYGSSTPYPASTTKPTSNDGLWAFFGTPYGTKIINKTTGKTKFLQANSWAELTETATEWVIANNTNKGSLDYFTVHAGTNNYLNLQNSSLKYWNDSRGATDNGSTFTIEEYSEDYAGDVATYISPYFDNQGSYFALTNDAYTTYSATWTAAKSTCNKTTYDELAAVVSNTANIVWPETGYYLLKNNSTNTYLNSTTANSVVSATNNAASSIVELIKNDDGTYYIKSQGQYLQAPGGSPITRNNTPVKFTPTIGSATKVSFTSAGGSTSGYENISISGSTVQGYPARGIDSDPKSYWIVEDAPENINITLHAVDGKSYGTMYLPFDAQVTFTVDPGTMTFTGTFPYIVEVNGTRATLTQKAVNKIKAGTPVLLINTEAAENITVTRTTGASELSGTNHLVGTYIDKTSLGDYEYIFGTRTENEVSELGFWKMASGKKVGANKAYLVYEGVASEVKGFSLDFSELTGISEIAGSNTQEKAIFDLSGRRIQEPTRGLYIVNGKKVIVK